MRMIFVRHGEPDYERDCLTEEGKRQAMAAANRLAHFELSDIYSSPQGRAMETAEYTAKLIGKPVKKLEFMREISWGGPNIPENGHPWTLGGRMMLEEEDLFATDWTRHPYFEGNKATTCFSEVTEKLDAFLGSQGYVHEGKRFFCKTDEKKTIALFSHGGSGACALSHILGLPFPYVLAVMPYGFTSLTVIDLPTIKEGPVYPWLERFNDVTHLERAEAPRLQRISEG